MSQETDLSRRDLLKTAGAVAAVAAVIEGAPAIQKVKAANDQVQYGMIGTGSRGTLSAQAPQEYFDRPLRGAVRPAADRA